MTDKHCNSLLIASNFQLCIYLLLYLHPTRGQMDATITGISSPEQHSAVCLDACGGEANLSGFPTFCGLLSCSSKGYRYKSCRLKDLLRIKSAVVYYRRSDSECSYHDGSRETYVGNGGIYGFKNNFVWVDNGCRAWFRICYTLWWSFTENNPTSPTFSTKSKSLATTSKSQPMSTKRTRVTTTTTTPATKTTRKITRPLPVTRPITRPIPEVSQSTTSVPATKMTKISLTTLITSTSKTTKSPSNPIDSSVVSTQLSTTASHTTLKHPTLTTTKVPRWSDRTKLPSTLTTNITVRTVGSTSLATFTTKRRKPKTGPNIASITPTRRPSVTMQGTRRSTNRYTRSSRNPKLSTVPSEVTQTPTKVVSFAPKSTGTTMANSVRHSSNTTPCVLCTTINSSRIPPLTTAPSSLTSYTPATNGHKTHTEDPQEDDGESKRAFPVTGIIIVAIVALLGFIILGVAVWRKRRATEDANATKRLIT